MTERIRPNAQAIIAALGLQPHPEGGWYAEFYRSDAPEGRRAAVTSIHYLLAEDEHSHWHRIDATEIWHHYGGDPIELSSWTEGAKATVVRLGAQILEGELPQWVIPPGTWQAARPLGEWSLLGCTVAPAFSFEGFELAPPGWSPPVD